MSSYLIFVVFLTCVFCFNFINNSETSAYVDQLEQRVIQPGLIHHRFLKHTKQGPVNINVLEVDLNKNFYVRPALADSKSIWSKSTVLEITEKNRAIAGINANYFDRAGSTIGALAIDKEWIISPVLNRAAFSTDQEQQIIFARPRLLGKIFVENRELKETYSGLLVTSINQSDYLDPQGISFYNHWWEKPIKCGLSRSCLLVNSEGTVELKIEISNNIEATNYQEKELWPTMTQYILSCKKFNCLKSFQINQKIKINWSSEPDWSEIIHSVGGGPYLLRNGQIILDKESENFTNKSGISGLAPRTAIGVTSRKRLIMLTADGRQKDTVGLSLFQLAKLMQDLGIKEAINLDGGGSTTMILGNQILNKPSNHKRTLRKVSTALLLFQDHRREF